MKKQLMTVSAMLLLSSIGISNQAWAGSHEIVNSVTVTQQSITCNGVVKDSSGAPVIGASVVIEGTSQGVITDMDGNFSLAGIKKGNIITVSFVGYQTQKIKWDGGNLNIVLKEDAKLLNEVVVVGYGVQKKVNLTGSVSSVSAKDINDIPVANTATLLQGRMPGLVLTQNGAQAGNDNPEIRVRGIGTFGNNNPMVLIDGIEASLSQISDIPSGDIENISVLKDAASASIYGVRAANGVILITTKKGSEGKVTVNYSGSYTIQTPGVLPNFVDGYNWALMKNEVNPNTYDEEALLKLKNGTDPDRYANTDWLDAVMRNAGMHQHHLSVSGGNQNTHFMTSVSFSDQDGIMEETGVKRISFRSNVDSKYNRFTFGLNVSGNKNDVQAPAVNPNGEGGIMRYVSWFTRPTVPVQHQNGHYGYVDGSLKNAELVKNPVEMMKQGYRENDQYRFNGKAFAALDLIDGLKFQTSFAYNFYLNATKRYTPKASARYDADGNVLKQAGEVNSLADYYMRETTWTHENILTYNKHFNLHHINIMLGHSLIGYKQNTTNAGKQGFPTELIYQLDGGTKNPSSSGNMYEYRLQSFFGRINYSYGDRYLLEFNLRHDGSSRMPKSNRYATFPSISAGWVFSNEKFMESYDWLFGKLRFSWGKLGNQEIGSYAYISTLGAQGNYYFDSKTPNAGMVSTSIANENIKWETTRTINVATDLGFFNNRLTTTFEWFDKKTSDILMQLSMPGIFLGSLDAPYQNIGKVRNRGWEWSINYQDRKGDWNWFAGFNISHVKNEILSMGNLEETINGTTINRVGEAIGSYYGYKAIGLYRTEEDLNRKNSKGQVIQQNGTKPKLGDIMFADINDDGNITPDDRQIIGNPFPSYSYGFNLGFGWKNLDFSTFWQGVAGIYRYNWETTSDIRGNLTDRWLDCYSKDNPHGSMPALGNVFNDQYSSFWLDKADYLRLKNLEVGYTFNQLAKFGVAKLRLYFAATNLLTFTSLDNFDPEKSSGDGRNDVHPNSRTYSFGINISF